MHFYSVPCLMFYNHQGFEVKSKHDMMPILTMHMYVYTESIRRYLGQLHKKKLSFNQYLLEEPPCETLEVLILLRNHGEMKALGTKAEPCPACHLLA